METFIGILIYLAIVIICYYINRKINHLKCKHNEKWDWNDVRINLFLSTLTPLSIFYWIYIICSKLPSLPEEPPKWL